MMVNSHSLIPVESFSFGSSMKFIPGTWNSGISWRTLGRAALFGTVVASTSYIIYHAVRCENSWIKKLGGPKKAKDMPRPVMGPLKNKEFTLVKPTKEQLELRKRLEEIPSRNSDTKVETLMVYPIKSCCGIQVDSFFCGELGPEIHTNFGIVRDRGWMVITKNNIFVTQRMKPRMCFIQPSIDAADLVINAPGMTPLRIPIRMSFDNYSDKSKIIKTKVWGTDICGVNCGEEASQWFSTFLEEDGLKFIHHPLEFGGRPCKNEFGVELWDTTKDKAAFQDRTPYNLLSRESVEDLNTRGFEREVPWINFRPSVLVTGCPPYDEDIWTNFSMGEADFRNGKLCHRCVLTTVDTETGGFRKDVLEVLRSYRVNQTPAWSKILGNWPLLAINLAIEKQGKISVGDRIRHF